MRWEEPKSPSTLLLSRPLPLWGESLFCVVCYAMYCRTMITGFRHLRGEGDGSPVVHMYDWVVLYLIIKLNSFNWGTFFSPSVRFKD